MKKTSWGLPIYGFLFVWFLYSVYPSDEGGNSDALAIILAFGLIIAVVLGIFVKNAWKKRKKEKAGKIGGKTKETPKAVVKKTFWSDPKTYFAILVGYFFFSMALSNGLFFGSITDIHALKAPAEGMLYVPKFGIIIAVLMCTFMLLLTENAEGLMVIIGFLGGIFLCIIGIVNNWFMPFNHQHDVIYPALKWLGMAEWTFHPDPQVSQWAICFFLFLAFVAIPYFVNKRFNNVDYRQLRLIRIMIVHFAIIAFGFQYVFFFGR